MDQWGGVSCVQYMRNHPSSFCTMLQDNRRYVLGNLNPNYSYQLVDVDGNLKNVEWKSDERGLTYTEEELPNLGVSGSTCEGGTWISENGCAVETNTVKNTSAPFSMDSVLPAIPSTDEEARRLIVHLTYSLKCVG